MYFYFPSVVNAGNDINSLIVEIRKVSICRKRTFYIYSVVLYNYLLYLYTYHYTIFEVIKKGKNWTTTILDVKRLNKDMFVVMDFKTLIVLICF